MAIMLGCCAVYALMGVCFRAAMLDGLPVPMLPFVRGAITVIVLAPWLLRAGPSALATRRPLAHMARSAAGSVGFVTHMLAILWLPLASAVAILHARPLWALPLAFLLLGEKVGWDRAIAAAVGFGGVLVIVGPDSVLSGAISAGTLAALGGGLAGALVLISIKNLSRGPAGPEPPFRVVAWYAIATVLIWAPVSAFVWVTPSIYAALLLLGGSLLAILGDFMASWAVRRAPVGLLAPVEYVQIPLAALLGLLVFAETPGWGLLWGTVVMVAATLYLAARAGR